GGLARACAAAAGSHLVTHSQRGQKKNTEHVFVTRRGVFVTVEQDVSAPRTLYAHSGDASIAYQVIGDGPINLTVANGPSSHLEIIWEEPSTARAFRRL